MFRMPTKKERETELEKRISNLLISINHFRSMVERTKALLELYESKVIRFPKATNARGIRLTELISYNEKYIENLRKDIKEDELILAGLKNQLAEYK